MNRQETFKIEEIKERARFLERSNELFKGQVLMTCSDCLTYVFDTICEAIIFIIHRVKEDEEYVGHFKEARILNIGSIDVCIYIKTDVESYTCKTLDSYRYEQESERNRKELEQEQQELNFMLGDSTERFLNNVIEKANLMKYEFNSSLFSFFEKNNKKTTEFKIHHMLDRYFGVNGWKKYWFTTRQINKISVELTLNVLLSDDCTVINVPSDKILPSNKVKVLLK